MSKQNKYTRSANGQECQIRIPGVCNGNPETTVLAHLNGGGMGMKRADIHAAYACSACHDVVDGRVSFVSKHPDYLIAADVRNMFYEGVIRTQEIMIKNGILVL